MGLPYQRRAGSVVFGQAEVLDVPALRQMWQPWLTMEVADSTHLIAKNSYLTWTAVCGADPEDILSRPWFSMYGSGALRAFVVGQARTTDHLQKDENCPPSMKDLRDTWSGWLHGDDPLRKLQATALLGFLTATLPIVGTPDPDPTVKDVVVQHYCYERAKAIRARDHRHGPSGDTMEYLARHAVDPAIRMLALVHLITFATRLSISPEKAAGWVADAELLLEQLDVLPRWLALTVENRLQRILALRYVRLKDSDSKQRALDRAIATDQELAVCTADSPVLSHVWAECHRLLLENRVKHHILSKGTPDEVADLLAELDRIEPHYPESRTAVGELYASNGQLDEAARHFESSAAGGSIHGAIAAFRAYECHKAFGDSERAGRALRLLSDLDPAADIDQYATA